MADNKPGTVKVVTGHATWNEPGGEMMTAQEADALFDESCPQDGLWQYSNTLPAPNGAKAQPVKLDYMETKILQACKDLRAEKMFPTDDLIAARLPYGQKGQPYTRETVNRKRNKMRERGIDV
jgi:hypothetical protein